MAPDHTPAIFEFGATEPIPLVLNGQSYMLAGKIPPGVMAELTMSTHTMPDGRVVCEAHAMIAFLGRLMNDEDRATFHDQVQNDTNLDNDDLGTVVNWLLEEHGKRPTVPPISSPDGRSANGTTSEVTP